MAVEPVAVVPVALGKAIRAAGALLAAASPVWAADAVAPGQAPGATAGEAEIRAQLSPRDETTLSAELPAEIVQLTARKGERFKKGQLLVAFDCAAQQAQLHKAQAVLHGAHKTYEVNQRLAKLQSVSALDVELAQAKMAEAQADIALYRSLLDKCQIVAPFDGRVVELPAHAHQYLKVGDPIMEILDDSQLDVEAIVPSQWLRWLKPGSRFTLSVEETGKDYQTEVVTLGARIDPVSQSIAVVGRIVGSHDELLAGMSGKAVFNPPR